MTTTPTDFVRSIENFSRHVGKCATCGTAEAADDLCEDGSDLMDIMRVEAAGGDPVPYVEEDLIG